MGATSFVNVTAAGSAILVDLFLSRESLSLALAAENKTANAATNAAVKTALKHLLMLDCLQLKRVLNFRCTPAFITKKLPEKMQIHQLSLNIRPALTVLPGAVDQER